MDGVDVGSCGDAVDIVDVLRTAAVGPEPSQELKLRPGTAELVAQTTGRPVVTTPDSAVLKLKKALGVG